MRTQFVNAPTFEHDKASNTPKLTARQSLGHKLSRGTTRHNGRPAWETLLTECD